MEKFLVLQVSVIKIKKGQLTSYKILEHFPVDHCPSPPGWLGAPRHSSCVLPTTPMEGK